MGEIDTYGEMVRYRLERWGREFALHRDCEYLGHQSKNLLQVLVEHKGEMPGRRVGYKPMEVDLDALAIEYIVSGIALARAEIACCLRAYYCGSGRVRVERLEQARDLIRRVTGRRYLLGRAGFLGMVEDGVGLVRQELRGAERR